MGKDDNSVDLLGLKSFGDAVNTLAKGTIEGIGAFLSKVCLPASEEFGLLLRDRISVFRATNLAKVIDKAKNKTEHLKDSIRTVNPKLLKAVVEESSWAEDEPLQELWANLLASAIDPNFKGTLRTAFVEIIRELEVVDVHLLNSIYNLTEEKNVQYIDVNGLNVGLNNFNEGKLIKFPIGKGEILNKSGVDVNSYEESLDNLMRVRCIESYAEEQNITTESPEYINLQFHHTASLLHGYEFVRMTSLGLSFVEACTKLKS